MISDDRQCTATSKQSGERCKRLAIRGGTVCSMHGGKSPAVAAAAEQRLVEAEAEAEVRRLWAGLADASPVTDPTAAMQRLAGSLQQLTDELGRQVNELKSIEAGDDLARVRGIYAAHDRAVGRLSSLLEAMQRLGIAEQQLQLEQDKARMVSTAVQEAMEAVGMGPEDRETFVRVLLARMRTVEAIAS